MKPRIKRSKDWPKFRDAFLKDNPNCAVCKGRTKLTAHHMIPVHIDPTKELVKANLLPMCESPYHNDHLIFGHLLSWRAFNPKVIDDAKNMRDKIAARRTA